MDRARLCARQVVECDAAARFILDFLMARDQAARGAADQGGHVRIDLHDFHDLFTAVAAPSGGEQLAEGDGASEGLSLSLCPVFNLHLVKRQSKVFYDAVTWKNRHKRMRTA